MHHGLKWRPRESMADGCGGLALARPMLTAPVGNLEGLRYEHRRIERVLEALDGLAARVEGGATIAAGVVVATIDFFRAFVDGCHHVKEEEGLLPVLATRGVDADVLAAVRAEHLRARELLRDLHERLASAADPTCGTGVGQTLRAYVTFQREHFTKEEQLFDRAAVHLAPDDDVRIGRALEAVERRLGGRRAYDALCRVGDALVAACREAGGSRVPPLDQAVAAHVMRPNVPTLVPEESLTRAASVMETLHVRELPVVQDARVVGILTLRDLLPHRGNYEWTPVRTAMTAQPITVEPHTPVRAIADLLMRRCINAVPVAAGGVLLGMVARSDLLQLLLSS